MTFCKSCSFFLFFFFFITYGSCKLSAQIHANDFVTIRAQLVGRFHQTPVTFARVINKTQLWGVLSDTIGIFTISARQSDTIYVSSIGYLPLELFVTDSLLKQVKIPTIWLNEKIYEMAEIDIQSLGSYQQFKYKVLHLQLPQNTIKEAIASIQRELKMIPKHQLQPQASVSLGSPITGLYNLFSKEGKSRRKLAKVKAQEKLFSTVSSMYNSDVVQSVTGLVGEQLDEFMIYYRPDDAFIMNANEYDIRERIAKDYQDFKKVKQRDKDLKGEKGK